MRATTALWLLGLLTTASLVGGAAPSGERKATTIRCGDYIVTQQMVPDGYQQCTITHGGRTVFTNGARFTKIMGPYNLTGHGRLNFVIYTTDGASGEGHDLVELGRRFRKLASFSGHVSNRFRWEDVDGDGQEERLLVAGFVYHLAGVPVIQRWKSDHYETAYDLMRRPADPLPALQKVTFHRLDTSSLEALGEQVPSRTAFIELCGTYLRLLASGNPDLATSALTQAGLSPAEQAAFCAAARASLRRSQYLSNLPTEPVRGSHRFDAESDAGVISSHDRVPDP